VAILTTLGIELGLSPQQYGTTDTSAVRRGVIANREIRVADSTLTRASAHMQLEVAAAQQVQIGIGSISSPRLLYIETDREIEVRTSADDGEATTVAPLSSGAPGILLKTGAFAGVWITNPGANPAVVAVVVAGLES
jgi:hypothetical protein